MMALNQDAVVTSSQDGIAECTRISTPISDIKPGRIRVNPRIAKVFPTVRKEEVTEGSGGGPEETKEKVKVAKKQLFPWLYKFNALCREAAGSKSYQRLDDLMNVYVRNVEKDVKNCYKKPNRASKLKMRMNDYMKLFHMLYKDIRKPLEYNHYFERMSDLLAMYLDMEIKASRRGKENPRTISDRAMSALFILLENSMYHILNAIIKAKFFIKMFHEICIPIIQRVLRDIPEELTDEQYIQYVLVFKKWKVLVGRKEERQEINRLAAERLTPPPGFTDLYHYSNKFEGMLPVVARGRKDKFTLMLMQAPSLSCKDHSEGYQLTSLNCESTVKSLDDLDLNEPLLSDELVGLYDYDDPKSERCITNYLKEVWTQLDDLEPNGLEDVMADLLEEDFTTKIKKRQAAEEKLRLEKAARKAPKAKKAPKIIENKPIPSHSGMGCMHSSVPRCYGRVAAGPASSMRTKEGLGRNVSKMEADSQSQTEIIVIDDDDDEPPIKKESEVKNEEQESVKREVCQPPVLRAVVRPENIQQLAVKESPCDVGEVKPAEDQVTVGETSEVEVEKRVENENETRAEEKEVEEEANGEVVEEAAVVEAEATSTSATPPTEPEKVPPLEEPKSATDLLLEEITKVSSAEDGDPQLWLDVDGNLQNQSLQDLFDPNDPTGGFMFYPEGPGDAHNWSFSHDFILGQYDDDLFSQYECGNTNAFPDFYNDQQDMVFTGGDILSPPLLDMMRDEPGEYQLTTHWEDLSMMVSESYVEKSSSSPERAEEDSGQTEDGPTVVFLDKRKGRRSKSKNKAKSSPPSLEVESVVEKKSKEKPVEDVSKKAKKGRRKRVHFEDDDEEEEEEEEPEPQPKKRKGRQKKTVEPPPPVQPPSPPPASSGRKSRNSATTKKKSQSRKR